MLPTLSWIDRRAADVHSEDNHREEQQGPRPLESIENKQRHNLSHVGALWHIAYRRSESIGHAKVFAELRPIRGGCEPWRFRIGSGDCEIGWRHLPRFITEFLCRG